MVSRGSKLQLLEDLKMAAATVTKTSYPFAVTKISDPSMPPNGLVTVKRNFSAEKQLLSSDPQYETKMARFLPEQEVYNDPLIQGFGINIEWFGVPLVNTRQDQGEIRVHFVGGTPAYMISTKPRGDKEDPDRMDIVLVSMTTPLNMMS